MNEITMQLTRTGRRGADPTTPGRAKVCGCGQWLDRCARQHCPRCGTTLAPAA